MNYFTQHAVGLFHAVISSDFMQDFSPGWWNAEVLSRSNDPKVHNQGNDQYWVKVDDGREICMRFTSELRALKACFFFRWLTYSPVNSHWQLIWCTIWRYISYSEKGAISIVILVYQRYISRRWFNSPTFGIASVTEPKWATAEVNQDHLGFGGNDPHWLICFTIFT